jgi:hypothetical protein
MSASRELMSSADTRMWNSSRAGPAALLNALAWIAGVVAGSLPKRLWPAMDG